MRNKPAYPLLSVDAALRLAQLLQATGPMRLSDVAKTLDVGVSTAHRLLSALVYRGFAEQLPDRRYGPGAAMRPIPTLDPAVSDLRDLAAPAMHALVESTGESANLVVLVDVDVYFVATVECARVLRVGERAGQRLPAHLTSGGKAMLAKLPEAALDRFSALGPVPCARLRRDIAVARRDGYGSNHQETERGVTAIGVALEPLPHDVHAAICLAMPTVRFRRGLLDPFVASLDAAARAIEQAATCHSAVVLHQSASDGL